MPVRSACAITLAALAALALPAARADRPLASETADVIDRGDCQVEADTGTTRSRGAPHLRTRNALITCGVAYQTQPALVYGRSGSGSDSAESLLLGAKTTFVMPSADRLGYGAAYSVAAVKVPGTSWRREELSVTGLVTATLGKELLGHANLGWMHNRAARQSNAQWSLGVETVGDFTVAADVFGVQRERPWASAGVGYLLGKGLSPNAVAAAQFETPRLRQLSVGAKLVF